MTHSTTKSTPSTKTFTRPNRSGSDAAPMVITRLSGWIDVGEDKPSAPSWIIPTRVAGQMK